jgi:hypothetical protein
MPQPYRSQILDHLGLVAGMFDELDTSAVIDQTFRRRHQGPGLFNRGFWDHLLYRSLLLSVR